MAGKITGRTRARSTSAAPVGKTQTGSARGKRIGGYGGRISTGARGGMGDAALGAAAKGLGRSAPGTGGASAGGGPAGGSVTSTTTGAGGVVIPPTSTTPAPTRSPLPVTGGSTGILQAPDLTDGGGIITSLVTNRVAPATTVAPTGSGSGVSANVGKVAPVLAPGSRYPGASKPGGTTTTTSVAKLKPKRPAAKPASAPTSVAKLKPKRPTAKPASAPTSSKGTTKPKRPAAKPAAKPSTTSSSASRGK